MRGSLFFLFRASHVLWRRAGVVVYLQQVPNEGIAFPDHGSMSEDNLIAYTWDKYLRGNATDPTWLLRLPMTRAGVNAMTAVQQFMASAFPSAPKITGFLVSGASKRGECVPRNSAPFFFVRYYDCCNAQRDILCSARVEYMDCRCSGRACGGRRAHCHADPGHGPQHRLGVARVRQLVIRTQTV